jgi:hypothetical protein
MQRVVTMGRLHRGGMRGASTSPLALISSETPAMTWQTLAMYSLLAGLGAYLADQAYKGAFGLLFSSLPSLRW